MARHIVCVLDRTVGHVSICWDYVSIFIYKNSNYNKINQFVASDKCTQKYVHCIVLCGLRISGLYSEASKLTL